MSQNLQPICKTSSQVYGYRPLPPNQTHSPQSTHTANLISTLSDLNRDELAGHSSAKVGNNGGKLHWKHSHYAKTETLVPWRT